MGKNRDWGVGIGDWELLFLAQSLFPDPYCLFSG